MKNSSYCLKVLAFFLSGIPALHAVVDEIAVLEPIQTRPEPPKQVQKHAFPRALVKKFHGLTLNHVVVKFDRKGLRLKTTSNETPVVSNAHVNNTPANDDTKTSLLGKLPLEVIRNILVLQTPRSTVEALNATPLFKQFDTPRLWRDKLLRMKNIPCVLRVPSAHNYDFTEVAAVEWIVFNEKNGSLLKAVSPINHDHTVSCGGFVAKINNLPISAFDGETRIFISYLMITSIEWISNTEMRANYGIWGGVSNAECITLPDISGQDFDHKAFLEKEHILLETNWESRAYLGLKTLSDRKAMKYVTELK